MLTKIFFLALACLASLSLAQQKKAYEPVNRLFTAESDVPRPDLECVVGVDSMAVSELYRVKCTDAWNISVEIDQKKANMWFADNHISDQDRIRRTVRFGIQGSGLKFEAKHYWANWTQPVTNWVCGYYPIINTVIFDCIPENQVPRWWKRQLIGPAFPSGMVGAPKAARSPGCNGGTCYCNAQDYCNDRHESTSGDQECPDYLPHHKWDQRCRK